MIKRKVVVRTSKNPHFPGRSFQETVTVTVPETLDEVSEFPINKTPLGMVQGYIATQQVNAARQNHLATSASPSLEGCQAEVERWLRGEKATKEVEASGDKINELAGDPEALAAYLIAAGVKVS